MDARKITFDEAWTSAVSFFIDNELEDLIDSEVEQLLEASTDNRVSSEIEIDEEQIFNYVRENDRGLSVVLQDITLSEEKFKRVVSLLRRIGRVGGGFDSEWNFDGIKARVRGDADFARVIVKTLLEGKNDPQLASLIPRYYLEKLNYKEIGGSAQTARKIRYKNSLAGSYGGKKGYKVENAINNELLAIQRDTGIPFQRGRSRLIDVNIDFAVPSLDDPWVVIMSSFQETTSSGQSTKARDMLRAYTRIIEINARNQENRVFVNFVDGGGWLARRTDFQRLVADCNYFLNFAHIGMLRSIVTQHARV